jgi:hypothetical protein
VASVTVLFQLALTRAAAFPGPRESPTDACLGDPEHETGAVTVVVVGEALLELDSAAHVVARVPKGPIEVQQVDDAGDHSSDLQGVGRSSAPVATSTHTLRA